MRMMMMIILLIDEFDGRDGMVMMTEIEIVTEGGDELENMITYIVKHHIHHYIYSHHNTIHIHHHHCLPEAN